MTEDAIGRRLRDLGVDLRRALHPPAGGYVNAITVDGVVHVSGHGPLLDGAPQYVGRVPSEVSVEEAYAAARLTAANCLATLQGHLGSLDRIAGFVKVFGMVNADRDFRDHPKVIDGASHLLMEAFGPLGAHARSAVGMGSLPFGIPVELEMLVRVR